MARRDRGVERALHRWFRKGLIDETTVETLRAEARLEHDADTLRVGQLLTALVGAVALFLAGVLFVSQTWPALSEATRTGVLFALALAVWLGGWSVTRRERWTRIGEVLQVAALALAMVAVVYSDNAWGQGSMGARITGLVSLAVPIVLGPAAWRGSVGLVAAHTAFALFYAALFLDRTFDLDFDTIVWVLDGLLLVGLAVTWLRLRTRWERGAHREIAAFATGLYAGLVLVLLTGVGPLDWDEKSIWALDLWLTGIVVLTWWGAARAPGALERGMFESHMAMCVLLATFFVGYTVAEPLGADVEVWAGAAALIAMAGLGWALKVKNTPTVIAATVSLVGVLWAYAVERSEARGAALAMAATAALLFWVASRIREGKGVSRAGAEGGEGVGG